MKGKSIPIVLIRQDIARNIFYNSPTECERVVGIRRELIYRALANDGLIEGTDIYVDYACKDWDVELYEFKGDDKLYGVQTTQAM